MSRAPVIRHARDARRLGCGHVVIAGSAMVRKRRTWFCAECQPWVRVRTVAEILRDAAACDDEAVIR